MNADVVASLMQPGADVLDLLEVARRPAWHADAECRDTATAIFFPGRGEPSEPARAMCARCMVRAECATAGLDEHHGIWGATSERERRKLRSACPAPTRVPSPDELERGVAIDRARRAEKARQRRADQRAA